MVARAVTQNNAPEERGGAERLIELRSTRHERKWRSLSEIQRERETVV
jgi:hypothetical protein